MQLFNGKKNYRLCRTVKRGLGFAQECLSPNFMVNPDGGLVCASCGTSYTPAELARVNTERRGESPAGKAA